MLSEEDDNLKMYLPSKLRGRIDMFQKNYVSARK